MSADEVVDLALRLIGETDYFDRETIDVFTRQPLVQRAIIATTLLRELPVYLAIGVVDQFHEIEME